MYQSGSAAALVSGISALQELQSLEINLGPSLGSIGRLRALTSLTACLRVEAEYPDIQLNLANPELQVLDLTLVDTFEDEFSNARSQVCASAEDQTFQLCLHHHPWSVTPTDRWTVGWANLAMLVNSDITEGPGPQQLCQSRSCS